MSVVVVLSRAVADILLAKGTSLGRMGMVLAVVFSRKGKSQVVATTLSSFVTSPLFLLLDPVVHCVLVVRIGVVVDRGLTVEVSMDLKADCFCLAVSLLSQILSVPSIVVSRISMMFSTTLSCSLSRRSWAVAGQ